MGKFYVHTYVLSKCEMILIYFIDDVVNKLASEKKKSFHHNLFSLKKIFSNLSICLQSLYYQFIPTTSFLRFPFVINSSILLHPFRGCTIVRHNNEDILYDSQYYSRIKRRNQYFSRRARITKKNQRWKRAPMNDLYEFFFYISVCHVHWEEF